MLVCGSRDLDRQDWAFQTLDELDRRYGPFLCVVVGVDPNFPRGADKLAWEWAGARGRERLPYPAMWKQYGPSAGPRRNAQMLSGNPDIALVIAFPGENGTEDMMTKARATGIKVIEIADPLRWARAS